MYCSLPKSLRPNLCEFPYPICDLSKNLISYMRPDRFKHFQKERGGGKTSEGHPKPISPQYFSYPRRAPALARLFDLSAWKRKGNSWLTGYPFSTFPYNEKEACSKKHTQFKTRVQKPNPYPIYNQKGYTATHLYKRYPPPHPRIIGKAPSALYAMLFGKNPFRRNTSINEIQYS